MAMFIRYDCVIDTPLRVLVERLDDMSIYHPQKEQFLSIVGVDQIPDDWFFTLENDKPIANIHSVSINTDDQTQFPTDAAYGFYVFNGKYRISELIPLIWSGSRVVVTVDGEVVYSS